MKRAIQTIFPTILLVALGVFAYTFREDIKKTLELFLRDVGLSVVSCEEPITYTVGAFDTRFSISRKDFLSALKEAETIWEEPLGNDLFAYTPEGDLAVNLVYDYRQEATDLLQNLGLSVDENKASYEALKATHATLNTRYAEAKTEYDARIAAFEKLKEAYDGEVRRWNSRGGAPPKEYARLEEEKASLQAAFEDIRKLQTTINGYVAEINALVVVLNRLAASLNLNVARYNEIGASRGEEFEEGLYESDGRTHTITIYEFSSRDALVRVLAHEFGHALQLDHSDDPKAIMYRLNTSGNDELTKADIEQLNARCGVR